MDLFTDFADIGVEARRPGTTQEKLIGAQGGSHL